MKMPPVREYASSLISSRGTCEAKGQTMYSVSETRYSVSHQNFLDDKYIYHTQNEYRQVTNVGRK